jgi:GDP-4-dehydro-6-deoxy-D-mannose reductase
MSRILCSRYAIPAVWARIFNIVGPGQDERHLCGQLISELAAISQGKAGALHIGSLEATRDYIDVRDAAQAVMLLARKGAAGEAYNVSTGEETSVRSVLEAAIEGTGLANRVHIEIGRPRDRDIPRHFGSNERLRALGFAPRFSLQQSLTDSFSYYCYYSNKSVSDCCNTS